MGGVRPDTRADRGLPQHARVLDKPFDVHGLNALVRRAYAASRH
jgi:hypothetical protein